MKPLGDRNAHYWKVIGMAKACEAEPQAAFASGDLSSRDWAELIENCRGCPRPAACDRLLAAFPTLQSPPDYCVNRSALTKSKSD